MVFVYFCMYLTWHSTMIVYMLKMITDMCITAAVCETQLAHDSSVSSLVHELYYRFQYKSCRPNTFTTQHIDVGYHFQLVTTYHTYHTYHTYNRIVLNHSIRALPKLEFQIRFNGILVKDGK